MLLTFEGRTPVVGTHSYVSETAQVIGDVVIGDSCYIGHGAIIRGDYGRVVIGDKTAVEEGVVIHAPPERFLKFHRLKITAGRKPDQALDSAFNCPFDSAEQMLVLRCT